MLTQLSLFDLPCDFDSPVAVVAITPNENPAAEAAGRASQPITLYATGQSHDSVQPVGDLARLVLARYEMVARRREEMLRRRAENPRKSIRVLA